MNEMPLVQARRVLSYEEAYFELQRSDMQPMDVVILSRSYDDPAATRKRWWQRRKPSQARPYAEFLCRDEETARRLAAFIGHAERREDNNGFPVLVADGYGFSWEIELQRQASALV